MKKNLCAGILVFLPSFGRLIAQDPFSVQSNASFALASYSNDQSNVLSFLANQATLGNIKNFSVGISGERRFMLSELGYYHLAAWMPFYPGGLGLMAKYTGFGGMSQSLGGLAYGRSFGQFLRGGIQFNYFSLKLPGQYGSASVLSFETGILARISEKFSAGLHISNPLNRRFGSSKEELLPSSFSIGLGYDASPKFYMGLIAEKRAMTPFDVNAGFIYCPVDQLVLNAGVLTSTSEFYVGAGFIKGIMRLDLSASYHPQLGFTPGISLIISGLNKKEP